MELKRHSNLLPKLSSLCFELYFTLNHSKQKSTTWRTHAQGDTHTHWPASELVRETCNETDKNSDKEGNDNIWYRFSFFFFFLETEIGSWCLGPATSDTPLLSLCNKCVKVMKASPMLGCETELILLHWIHRFPLKTSCKQGERADH